jgi:hypothetical protein
MGYGVWGIWYGELGTGCGVWWGMEYGVYNLVWGSGLGYRVWDIGYRKLKIGSRGVLVQVITFRVWCLG